MTQTQKSYRKGGLVSIVSYSRPSLMIIVSWTQFHQEKALVGAFSVITNLRMDLFEAQSQVWRRTVSTGLPILCIIYSEQYVECGGGGGVLIERGGALLH